MSWLWRILVVILLGLLLKSIVNVPARTFISWSQGLVWVERVQWQIHAWQQEVQDLPASMELEIRRLWQEYHPSGDSQQV